MTRDLQGEGVVVGRASCAGVGLGEYQGNKSSSSFNKKINDNKLPTVLLCYILVVMNIEFCVY